MFSQQQLVCDSSTLANFKQWAVPISNFIGACGFFVKAPDTGQVDWNAIAAVPGTAAFIYEVWQSNDGLTQFFMKVKYGNVSGTNCPSLIIEAGESTDGAGNWTGHVIGSNTNVLGYAPPSATIQYECNFSGAPGRIAAMMWRDGANNCQQFFGVERSVDATGAYTGSYITLLTVGCGANNSRGSFQVSLVFGVGASPSQWNTNSNGGWVVPIQYLPGSWSFNASIPVALVVPQVGYFDFPCTMAAAGNPGDLVEGITFEADVYGATHTYLPSSQGFFSHTNPRNDGPTTSLCMRFD